jgi:hypothetical protein
MMNTLDPKVLASALPIGPDEAIFHCVVNLGSEFTATGYDLAAKVPLDKLPFLFVETAHKNNGEKWSVGFNLYEEGGKYFYQSFFFKDNPPAATTGPIENGNDWHKVGGLCTVGTDEESQAKIPRYSWLTCTTQPVDCSFDLVLGEGQVQIDPANPVIRIAKETKFQNDSADPVTYTPTVTYDYMEKLVTSVTDSHSFAVGGKIKWGTSIGWFGTGTKLEVEVSLEYGMTHETTSTTETSSNYGIEEQLTLEIKPYSTKYVSVLLSTDDDATAQVLLDVVLSGTMNGERLSGDYLERVVLAMDDKSQILAVGADQVSYRIIGAVEANVVASSDILTSDTPLGIVGQVLPPAEAEVLLAAAS